MSLTSPTTVGKLQSALRERAKNEPQRRFHALYDKVYRNDILAFAYARCRANGGVAGVDGQTFADIAEYGVEKWLGELAEELRKKTYRPEAVQRAWTPKPDGTQRPLGIPTIRDRVAQMAVLLVLEPIFDSDLQPEQYAYRAQRGALDAVEDVAAQLRLGCREVVDADLSGYFDSIPHHELMQCVARRISDGAMLHLVKVWLEAPVEETDERGHRQRTTRNRDTGRGTPQGGVLSPLLANLYMRRFALGWKTLGYAQRLKAKIVNYADDFVICCGVGMAEPALAAMRQIMEKLKLTVNETKTRICRLPDETFDFLSYTFGRQFSPRSGEAYVGVKPSAKSVAKLLDKIRKETEGRSTGRSAHEVVKVLNRKLRGWTNYFCRGTKIPAYETVLGYTRRRLRRWLCRKHKVRRRQFARFSNEKLHGEYGLYLPPGCTKGLRGKPQPTPKGKPTGQTYSEDRRLLPGWIAVGVRAPSEAPTLASG